MGGYICCCAEREDRECVRASGGCCSSTCTFANGQIIMAGAILVLTPIYAIVHLIVGIGEGQFYAAGRETYNQRATTCQTVLKGYCVLEDVTCTQQKQVDVTPQNPCVPQENYPYESYGEPLLSEATAGTMGVSLTVVWLQIVNDFSMALVTTIVIWSLVGPARKHAAKPCRVGTLCHLIATCILTVFATVALVLNVVSCIVYIAWSVQERADFKAFGGEERAKLSNRWLGIPFEISDMIYNIVFLSFMWAHVICARKAVKYNEIHDEAVDHAGGAAPPPPPGSAQGVQVSPGVVVVQGVVQGVVQQQPVVVQAAVVMQQQQPVVVQAAVVQPKQPVAAAVVALAG